MIPNEEYPRLKIQKVKNGYIVTPFNVSFSSFLSKNTDSIPTLKDYASGRQQFIFKNFKELYSWLNKNISSILDITDFVENLKGNNEMCAKEGPPMSMNYMSYPTGSGN